LYTVNLLQAQSTWSNLFFKCFDQLHNGTCSKPLTFQLPAKIFDGQLKWGGRVRINQLN